MKNNKHFSKDKQLVKTREQAEIALNILVQNSQREDLEIGVFRLRDQLINPGLTKLLDSFPELIQEYELDRLFTGEIEIKDTRRQDIMIAGLLSCLLLLIHFYFDNDEDKLIESESDIPTQSESIKYVLNTITSEKFINELFLLVLSIVGIDYFEKYQEKMKDPDFVLKQTVGFDSDPEMDKHIDMMVWFALVRLFIEAIFIYYNDEYQIKNDQL